MSKHSTAAVIAPPAAARYGSADPFVVLGREKLTRQHLLKCGNAVQVRLVCCGELFSGRDDQRAEARGCPGLYRRENFRTVRPAGKTVESGLCYSLPRGND